MTTEAKRAYQVYEAGPMTNKSGFNFPLFFAGASWLRIHRGWQVLSPAEKDLISIPWNEMVLVPGFESGDLGLYVANSSFTMGNAMEWDLPAIMQSDGIVLLPGWETSTGARWERIVAEALGRTVWLLSPTGIVDAPMVSDIIVGPNGEPLVPETFWQPLAFTLEEDPVQQRITPFLRDFPQSIMAGSL